MYPQTILGVHTVTKIVYSWRCIICLCWLHWKYWMIAIEFVAIVNINKKKWKWQNTCIICTIMKTNQRCGMFYTGYLAFSAIIWWAKMRKIRINDISLSLEDGRLNLHESIKFDDKKKTPKVKILWLGCVDMDLSIYFYVNSSRLLLVFIPFRSATFTLTISRKSFRSFSAGTLFFSFFAQTL